MVAFNDFLRSVRTESDYGRRFEVFVKWFLKTDPEWSTQVDEIWLWDEWPDRWGPDCGIDLVFRHKNGQTWAVQAKCYDHANAVFDKFAKDIQMRESNSSLTALGETPTEGLHRTRPDFRPNCRSGPN